VRWSRDQEDVPGKASAGKQRHLFTIALDTATAFGYVPASRNGKEKPGWFLEACWGFAKVSAA